MLEQLYSGLFDKANGRKVAILIDEYDAPIVRKITEPAKADIICATLKDFYGVLKTDADIIGHIFITGVSRFTKTSIFSESSHLQDITLDPKYATICGLTEKDLDDLLCERQEDPPCEHREILLNTLLERKKLNLGTTLADLRQ
jgi:hypothetical protein